MDIKPSNYNDFSDLNSLRLQATTTPNAAVAPTARKFEAVFVQMMMKSMRSTLPQDGLFSSQETQTYQDMLDGQYALNISDHGGIGLAKVITQQLSANTPKTATPSSQGTTLAKAGGLSIGQPATAAAALTMGAHQSLSIGSSAAGSAGSGSGTALRMQLLRGVVPAQVGKE